MTAGEERAVSSLRLAYRELRWAAWLARYGSLDRAKRAGLTAAALLRNATLFTTKAS